MPCRGPTDAECAADNAAAHKRKVDELTKERDTLTEMLCFMCRGVEQEHGMRSFRGDIGKWWTKHKKLDAARIAAEQLNPEQLNALVAYVKKHGTAP